MNSILTELGTAVINGDAATVVDLVQQGLDKGIGAEELLSTGLIAEGMNIVGQRFKTCEMFVPEVMAAARAMHQGMGVLRPKLISVGAKSAGKVIIGTVQGDHHDIGKRIVTMMLEGGGFEVKDIGVDVTPDTFLAEARSFGAHIIGMSTLLTTTIPALEKTCAVIKESELNGKVKIIAGGAPLSERVALNAGADVYVDNAGEVVEKTKEIMKELLN